MDSVLQVAWVVWLLGVAIGVVAAGMWADPRWFVVGVGLGPLTVVAVLLYVAHRSHVRAEQELATDGTWAEESEARRERTADVERALVLAPVERGAPTPAGPSGGVEHDPGIALPFPA